jgi:hypothetical protein
MFKQKNSRFFRSRKIWIPLNNFSEESLHHIIFFNKSLLYYFHNIIFSRYLCFKLFFQFKLNFMPQSGPGKSSPGFGNTTPPPLAVSRRHTGSRVVRSWGDPALSSVRTESDAVKNLWKRRIEVECVRSVGRITAEECKEHWKDDSCTPPLTRDLLSIISVILKNTFSFSSLRNTKHEMHCQWNQSVDHWQQSTSVQ